MYCPYCRALNNDANHVCIHCGRQLHPQQPAYGLPRQPGVQPQQYQAYQPPRQQGAPLYGQPMQQNYVIPNRQNEMTGFSAFWNAVMTYAGFFVSAAGFFFLGLGSIIGWQYAAKRYGFHTYRYVEYIADELPGLRILDIIVGIGLFAFSGLCIFAWFQFKSYRSSAPALTLLIYISFVGLYVVYNSIVVIVLSGHSLEIGDIYPLAFPLILLMNMIAVMVLNIVYFSKEKRRYNY